MKKLGVGCLSILVLLVLAVTVAFFVTRALPRAADDFLSLVAQGDLAEAYESTAAGFKAATELRTFEQYIAGTGLKDYRSATWSSRSIVDGHTGKLEGTVTTKADGKIPVVLDFVREEGQWRILALQKTPAGLREPAGQPGVPDDPEVGRLVSRAMRAWAEAVHAGDFTQFHGDISTLWRRQSTPDSLRDTFAAFIDLDLDFTPLSEATPVLNRPPAIDEDGALVVEGYYDTDPEPVLFRLTYTYEHPDWKLIGINVRF